ncbi:MAG: alanine racemase [Spirochaetales bacterium]|nr:alanine racemase [Spirochaetales bacterium]
MRSTRAFIDLDRLEENYTNIKESCNNAQICAAIKADAYGHGAIEVAKKLEKLNCTYFGIATTLEAKELIDNSITTPLILLSLPALNEIPFIVKNSIEPVVTTKELIENLNRESKIQNIKTLVHLKIDTGMGRIGCNPNEAVFLAQLINNSSNLILQGVCTHFSTSELINQDYTNSQLNKFKKSLQEIRDANIEPKFIHAANSGAILMNKDAIFNLVRTGINLYGYGPAPNPNFPIELKPIMELKTIVISLKEHLAGSSISYGRTFTTTEKSIIATLPIGYADGYSRALSNLGEVLINGKRYPIVGNICMDQLMVKVDKSVKLYDEVVVLGYKDGAPNAEDIAKKIGTISYEILTSIQRVKRYYINS